MVKFLALKLITYLTRLETRTKEFNVCASYLVVNYKRHNESESYTRILVYCNMGSKQMSQLLGYLRVMLTET